MDAPDSPNGRGDGHHHGPAHGHAHGHGHDHDLDWDAMAVKLELEGEVVAPYIVETAAWIAARCRDDGLDVGRVVDVGSGPGVGTCVLAQQFEQATVVAVDGSPALLARVDARAAARGLQERVRTHHADLPAGLAGTGPAEVVWAAMVLHHLGDERAALRAIRAVLVPGGLLAIAEFGDPVRFVPDDVGIGRPGWNERVDAASEAWVAAMRADLPDSTPSDDYPTMLVESGFEVVAEWTAEVRLGPPLPDDARRAAILSLQRTRGIVADRLDDEDLATLDVLVDPDHPLGMARRPDARFAASRRICVARSIA
jgi:SAM-dependent methyltransferase